MIVTITEYSYKTGKGTAETELGDTVRFTYKSFKDGKALAVGSKANLVDNILFPAVVRDTIGSTTAKLFKLIRGKLWR